MLRMLTDPVTYRPGGGETTLEMRNRVTDFVASLPRLGVIVLVTHGGPIAAVSGTLQKHPVSDWASLIPTLGEYITITPLPGAALANSLKLSRP
jgi:broad specificity phosphatase PhoE